MRLLRRADQLIKVGRARDAIPLVLQALAMRPDWHEALCTLALAHLQSGNALEALSAADRATGASPDAEWGHRLRAFALLRLGRHKAARYAAEQAVRLAPLARETLCVLAEVEIAGGMTTFAGETCGMLLEVAPEWEETHDLLGRVALAEQRYADAEASFLRALAIRSDYWQSLNNLALSLRAQGRHKEAVERLHQAVRLAPAAALVQENLATSLKSYAKGSLAALFIVVQLLNFAVMTGLWKAAWVRPTLAALGIGAALIAAWLAQRFRRLRGLHPSLRMFRSEKRSTNRRAQIAESVLVVYGFLIFLWTVMYMASPERYSPFRGGDTTAYLYGLGTIFSMVLALAYIVEIGQHMKARRRSHRSPNQAI